jgi:hypothetical protein
VVSLRTSDRRRLPDQTGRLRIWGSRRPPQSVPTLRGEAMDTHAWREAYSVYSTVLPGTPTPQFIASLGAAVRRWSGWRGAYSPTAAKLYLGCWGQIETGAPIEADAPSLIIKALQLANYM